MIKRERYKYKHQNSKKQKEQTSTTILLVVLLPEVVHLLRFHKMIEIVVETLIVLPSAAVFPDTQKPTSSAVFIKLRAQFSLSKRAH